MLLVDTQDCKSCAAGIWRFGDVNWSSVRRPVASVWHPTTSLVNFRLAYGLPSLHTRNIQAVNPGMTSSFSNSQSRKLSGLNPDSYRDSNSNDLDLAFAQRVDKQTYYRLIALWVICETVLGGIIHGFKLPVSGLLVGSCAVICICLIAWYVPEKGAILKATVTVAIFKMMLSPQSPLPAYVAVLFQGIAGEFIFLNRKYFRFSCLLLGIVALFESGIQRILVLTVLYGTNFWKAVNEFISGLTRDKEITNYSLYLAGGYVLIHVLAGAATGWMAGTIPRKIKVWRSERNPMEGNHISPAKDAAANQDEIVKPGTRKRKTGLLIAWILLLGIYVQSESGIGEPLLPAHLVVNILVRSFLIVLTWYFLVAPVLLHVLTKWLKKQQLKSQHILREIVVLLPVMRQLVQRSWQHTQGKRGWSRWKEFGKTVLVEALPGGRQVFIVTGPVRSGKTTQLQKWTERRNDVYGILTPVREGKRFFLDLKTNALFPMEASESENEIISVGKYQFSHAAFQRAKGILLDALAEKTGWVVVDEIGPLELEGKGFSNEAVALLKNQGEEQKLVFVIRESLLEKAVKHFGLEGKYSVIR